LNCELKRKCLLKPNLALKQDFILLEALKSKLSKKKNKKFT